VRQRDGHHGAGVVIPLPSSVLEDDGDDGAGIAASKWPPGRTRQDLRNAGHLRSSASANRLAVGFSSEVSAFTVRPVSMERPARVHEDVGYVSS